MIMISHKYTLMVDRTRMILIRSNTIKIITELKIRVLLGVVRIRIIHRNGA